MTPVLPKLLGLVIASHLVLVCQGAFPNCEDGPLATNLVCNPDVPSLDRARALVAEFTVPEVIQNTGNESPGVSRLGLPAYNWWNEALHGFGGSPGSNFSETGEFSYSTSFPAPILMAAAFDDALIHDVSTIISTEARAFHNANRSGIDFWAPNINPFRDPRWGRGQETPGEDPFRIAQYVYQYMTGMQGGVNPKPYLKIVADCKHWAAYDIENWEGNDRTEFNAVVSTQDFAEYYSPPFQSCVRDAKAASVMCSYNEVNGVPSCANSYLLQTLVRDFWELGDDQWVVGDCAAVEAIATGHQYTNDIVNASALALRAGVDIDCGITYPTNLGKALNQSLISEDNLRKALVRQYHSLIRTGYFDPPERQPYRQLKWSDVNTKQTQELAHRAAVEGMVLLKNDGILPLKRSIRKIALVGPFANATQQMQSNYAQPAPFIISPLQAFREAAFDVAFANGTAINTTDTSGFAAAIEAARKSDVIIFAGGMDLSVEDEFRDRTEISWPGNQLDLIKELAALKKPFIVLSMGGGQVDCSWLKGDPRVNGIVWGGLPSQSGGPALLDIITGKKAPAGRLPITQYPASYVDEVPMTDMSLRPKAGSSPGRTYKWYTGKPVYEFGFGLHYTTFQFKWVDNAKGSYDIQELVDSAKSSGVPYIDVATFDTFKVSVTNTGKTTSDFAALLFSRTKAGPSPAPLKELVSYTKMKDIAPGQSAVALLKVTLGSIARTDENGNKVLYPGKYELLFDYNGAIRKTITLTGKETQILAWPQAS
ncbi:glycoside hydrolase family 3 protein [Moniliophthora roreri]|uniref:xylan 1,4-beta-xylosidase n=1 Tax=Moniliophthora roreri TaxID=221103 RepID=A0A0W0FRG7_MONRR|nr:glycoside hydrolase family 3 protein [Moniliophthora roreri]